MKTGAKRSRNIFIFDNCGSISLGQWLMLGLNCLRTARRGGVGLGFYERKYVYIHIRDDEDLRYFKRLVLMDVS